MIVTKSMYSIGQRKYIDIDDKQVKIRWRYNRPMVKQESLKTIFEYKEGDTIHCKIDTVLWEGEVHLVLKSICD
jgi:hypothetical protein